MAKGIVFSSLLAFCTAAAVSATPIPQSVEIDATSPHCNDMYVGLRILTLVMNNYYNTKAALENEINSDVFNVLGTIGTMDLYFRELEGYPNVTNNSFHGMLAAIMRQIVKSTCHWLKSHGEAFSLFAIDCHSDAELSMMSSYLRLLPNLQSVQSFLGSVCNPSLNKTAWIDTFIPDYYDQVVAIEMATTVAIYE